MKSLSLEFTADYIYLYEQDIRKKEIVAEKKYRIDMPPNAYYNRMLLNNDRSISDAIKNCVSEHRIRNRKVVLIVSGTDSMVETFSVLAGSKKQIDGMVEQELRKRHKLHADYLYDYIVMGEDPLKEGFIKIQVTLCAKAMIRNTYEIIRKAGLIPYRIVFMSRAMEELADSCGLTQAQESSILACIHGDEAHYLYVGHGLEPYYRHGKLQSEQKAEENLFVLSSINNRKEEADSDAVLQQKVQEDLMRLERFHQQRYPNKEIAHIYLYGSYGKISDAAKHLQTALGIPVEPLRAAQIQGVHYAFQEEEYAHNGVAAAMSLSAAKEAQYDFFGRLEETRIGDKDKMLFLPSMLAGAILIAVLSAALINKYQNTVLSGQADELAEFLSGEDLQRQFQEKDHMIETCSAYAAYNNRVAAAIDLLESMPRFESSILRVIDRLKPEGTVITGYSFKEGTVSLGCYAKDQYAPAEFARILEESGQYEEVGYTGFRKNTGPMGEINYSFTINIKLW